MTHRQNTGRAASVHALVLGIGLEDSEIHRTENFGQRRDAKYYSDPPQLCLQIQLEIRKRLSEKRSNFAHLRQILRQQEMF